MTKLLKLQNSVGIINLETINKLTNVSSKEINIYNNDISLVKFKDYTTKEELALMSSLLVRWSSYLGIEAPDSIQLNTICNFLKENFQNLNHQDLDNTINMVVKDELKTDTEHYGKLSLIYINKCLKSYIDYKGSVIVKIREKLQKIESEKIKEIDPKERLNNFKKLISYAYNDFLEKKVYEDFGNTIYNFIRVNSLFKITPEIINNALEYGNNKFFEEKKRKSIESTIKQNFFKTTSDLNFEKEDKVKNFARQYVVNLWLKDLDLKEFLSKLTIEMIEKKLPKK